MEAYDSDSGPSDYRRPSSRTSGFTRFSSVRRINLIIFFTVFGLCTSLATVFYVLTRYSQLSSKVSETATVWKETGHTISRIAFGSCLQVTVGNQPVWRSIEEVDPHVWIWLGDFVYGDLIDINCTKPEHADFTGCQCNRTYLTRFANECHTGDLVNARSRYERQLSQVEYRKFIDFMCSGNKTGSECEKPILGTWDDHDYLWNNGNKRLPQKNEAKQLYLDAIGEAQGSPRRNSLTGLEAHYVFNKGDSKKEISIFLLDERYYRDPLPCKYSWDYCQKILKEVAETQTPESRKWRTFCEDFVKRGEGCCSKDDFLNDPTTGWCTKHVDDKPLPDEYEELCNHKSNFFGSRTWTLDESNMTAKPGGPGAESPFCEVLGYKQRNWLRKNLASSKSRVNILASSSVFATSDTRQPEHHNDTWFPYNNAQHSLISTITQTNTSCAILLAGDLHYADIRVLKPGEENKYSERYGTDRLDYPLYQVLASGMTSEIMEYQGEEDQLQNIKWDPDELRPKPEFYTPKPNFGLLDIDWFHETLSIEVRMAEDASVAFKEVIDLKSCTKSSPADKK